MLELGNAQTTSEEVAVHSVELQYASARGRLPWGPVLFSPSLLAVACIASTIVGTTWLALRHHPWHEVARVPSAQTLQNPFTSDGLLMTLDYARGANLWDPATGPLVRNVLPKLDPATGYFPVKGGEEILAIPQQEPVATFYDGRSGRMLRRVANPMQSYPGQPRVYPDGSRLITDSLRSNLRSRRSGSSPRSFEEAMFPLMVWDLSESHATVPPQPVASLPVAGYAWLSPDGNRILQSAGRATKGYVLIDARTLRVIDDQPGADGVRLINSEVFGTSKYPGPNQSGVYSVEEIRSLKDGKVLHTLSVPSFPVGWGGAQVTTTGDGRYIVVKVGFAVGGRVGGFPPTPATIQFYDVRTGKLAYSHRSSMDGSAFFGVPSSSRYVTTDLGSQRLGLFDARHQAPLALLGETMLAGRRGQPQFSPDGKTILLRVIESDEVAAIYRRAGWDVPESPLGAVAFPQTWLVAGSLVAAVVALFRDAGRRGRAMPESPRGLALVVLAVSLPLAAYSLLCACLGDVRQALWPAPAALLVLAAIGLALGSRFWRVVSLWTFSGTLPYVLWMAHRVWRAGPKESTLYPLLDRHYQVPHLPVLIGLLCAAALLGLALVVLARSTRQAAVA